MRLWDIMLGAATGMSYAGAAEHTADTGERFDVRAFAIPEEQAREVFEIMYEGLAGTEITAVGMLWADLGPTDYAPDGDA